MKEITRLFLIALAASCLVVPVYRTEAASHAENDSVNKAYSRNWAGYVADKGSYDSVEGDWTVSEAEADTTRKADATWVGIGGVAKSDLIQAGTVAVIDSNGNARYIAWYELLPENAVEVSLAVHPGDQMHTSITQVADTKWHIILENKTTGRTFEKTVTYRSSRSTAEWVEEMLTDGRTESYIPIDDFDKVTFTNAHLSRKGEELNLEDTAAHSVTMLTPSREVIASVSKIHNDDEFTVTREEDRDFQTSRTFYIQRWPFRIYPF